MENYQIRVNGKLLSTPVAWEFTLYNSMFNMDAVPGTRTYEIKLPSTPEVRRTLGRLDDPAYYREDILLPASIEQKGILIDTGVVSVKVQGKDYVLSFSSNLSKVLGDYTDRLLSDVAIGTANVTGSESSYIATTYTAGFVLAKVKNTAFLGGDTVAGFAGFMNDNNGNTFSGPVAVPMVYVKHVLEEWASLSGVSFSGDYVASEVLGKALFYANIHRVGNFSLAEQLPSMRMPQLLMDLRKAYNLWVRIDGFRKVVRMDFVKDVISKAPELDWSRKFGKIKGSPAALDGINLKFAKDSGDELVKGDVRFNDYLAIGTRGAQDVSSVLSGMSEDGTIAACKQQGFYLDKQGKVPTPRILYFNSTTKQGEAGTGGVDFSAADHAAAYYAEWEAFMQQGFSYTGPVNLNSNEVAAVAACFAGANEMLPLVHAQGANWLLEKLVVPTVGLPVVTMWRV